MTLDKRYVNWNMDYWKLQLIDFLYLFTTLVLFLVLFYWIVMF